MSTVTKKYKAEQQAILKQMVEDFKNSFKVIKKQNKKLCKAFADMKRYKTFNLEWYQVERFEENLELLIEVYRNEELIMRVFEEVVKPLIPESLKVRAQRYQIDSLTTFSISEKDSCYVVCKEIFSNWVPTEIVDGNLVVNGNEVGKSTWVGTIIGKGKRIHRMQASVRVDDDGKEYVGIWNGTQWRNSSVLIIDLDTNIPKDAWSLV